jgi:hypothetical protein
MGISKGGQSLKPYVGSKEVAEAYVGSQLVYKAGLPYYYYFLGAETTYYISNNCQLAYYASVTKPAWATTYKIAIGASTGTTSPRIQLFNVSEFIGRQLKFLYRGDPKGYENNLQVIFRRSDNTLIETKHLTFKSQETLAQYTVPAGCARIDIQCIAFNTYYTVDAIRFEET